MHSKHTWSKLKSGHGHSHNVRRPNQETNDSPFCYGTPAPPRTNRPEKPIYFALPEEHHKQANFENGRHFRCPYEAGAILAYAWVVSPKNCLSNAPAAQPNQPTTSRPQKRFRVSIHACWAAHLDVQAAAAASLQRSRPA